MSLEMILAMVVATQIIMLLRLHTLRARLERTEWFACEVMREGAPQMYKEYEKWREEQCSDK